jgi:hypothetical protein
LSRQFSSSSFVVVITFSTDVHSSRASYLTCECKKQYWIN